MECERCKRRYATSNKMNFCGSCLNDFNKIVDELRLAYIHHYMHPEKKTIYVHDNSRRFKPTKKEEKR